MNFGDALASLKAGNRISRAGWNGKGMWLALVRGDQWEIAIQVVISPGQARLLPWIGMKTADGGFVPWLASQTDVLAEDWSVCP